MTLRARLTAAFLAVVLGPVLVGAIFVGGTVATVSNARSEERLEVAATAVRTTIDAICAGLRTSAEAAAALAAAGQTPQRVLRAAGEAADQAVRRRQAAVARVDDADGETTHLSGFVSAPWTLCTDGGPGVGGVRALALGWRVELRDAEDQLVGHLLVARPVDANLVDRLAGAAGVEVTVIDSREAPLSTLSSQRAKRVASRARDLADGEVVESGDGLYLRAVRPTDGQPLHLVLSTSRGEEQSLFAVLLAVVVFAGLLAIGAAWWLARTTTRPLAELATAADRVADGDLDARVPVRSADEVGRLATTFNRMTRETQGYVQALTASRDQLRGNLGLLGDTLSSTHDLGRILEVILETAMAATGARAGVVLLVEQPDGLRTSELAGRCAKGLEDRAGDLEGIRLQLGEGLLGAVATSGEPRRGRVEWDGPVLSPREPRCRTYVAVPFSASRHGEDEDPSSQPERLLGVLALYDRLGHDDFDDADLITLRTFAGQAAVAVENVLLHEETHRLSLTDPLTGLWNYRYLKESLRREVERASRFERDLAVLTMDLDRFKDVNDTYGHPVGDAVLIEFARRIKTATREVDLAFRQGGEEFVVLLPETDAAGGERVAERLCAAIRETPFELESGDGSRESIRITVSAGVAVYPEHGHSLTDVLEAADDALYAAKAAGRDTWRVAPTPASGVTAVSEPRTKS
ncbi:MAG: diguanylate cyclase [Micromonosporaceae bacterium]|nr:diguanylate cyclase [Micromonosporaceae bacterium]